VEPDLDRREKPTLEDERKFLDIRCVREGAPDKGEPGGGSYYDILQEERYFSDRLQESSEEPPHPNIRRAL
jgi:hypothetical protein